MEKIKCYACRYAWFSHSNGNQHVCPRCGSDRIQFVLDSRVRDIQAGVSLTNPAALCIPSGSKNRYRIQMDDGLDTDDR